MSKILTNDIILSCSKLTLRQPKGCEFSLKEWLEANGYCTDCSESGGGGEILGLNTRILFFDGDDNPAGEPGLTYIKSTNTLQLGDTASPAAAITSYTRVISAQGNLIYFKDNDAAEAPNLFIGTVGNDVITIGISNVAVGTGAGASITSGNNNFFGGIDAGGSNTTGSLNLFLGYQAGLGIIGSSNITAIGNNTLTANPTTTLQYMTAIGYGAAMNYTGQGNSTFIGYESGINATGTGITAIGNQTAISNTGGEGIFIGNGAGQFSTTANGCVCIGNVAGLDNLTGNDNTYVGFAAGEHQLGSFNTAIGSAALKSAGAGANTGTLNVAVGFEAGTAITTGIGNVLIGASSGDSITSGSGHILIGYQAGASLTTNDSNVIIGYIAGDVATASGLTFVGTGTGGQTTTGTDLVFLGSLSGTTNTTGSAHTLLGTNTDVSINNLQACIAIGASAIATASNQCVIGSASYNITNLYLGGGVTALGASSFATVINATGGSGTDVAGANITIAGGRPTGAGLGGHVIIQTAPAGVSSSTLGTLATMAEFTDDAKIGFYGVTPVVRSSAYTVTNRTTDRNFDCNSTSVDELADVLGTVILDLQSVGLFS